MSRRVYLSARWGRQAEMRSVRDWLQSNGNFRVCASWIDEPEVSTAEHLAAATDMAEVLACDVFVAFTETPSVGYYTGGRHVELGIAISRDIPVVCIGPLENIFYHLSCVRQFESIEDWVRSLV